MNSITCRTTPLAEASALVPSGYFDNLYANIYEQQPDYFVFFVAKIHHG